jgi:hypothetical protein
MRSCFFNPQFCPFLFFLAATGWSFFRYPSNIIEANGSSRHSRYAPRLLLQERLFRQATLASRREKKVDRLPSL